jgi:uncharacterized protein (TIGR02284 family)
VRGERVPAKHIDGRKTGEPMRPNRLYDGMITNDDQAVLVLNSLIRSGKDAEQGYLAAADLVAEQELIQLFADFGLQRAKFVAELEERVRTLRATPAKTGTTMGELHRGWMGFKANNESNETHAILSECERGEDMSVMAYREALGTRDLDQQTRALIQRQYELVQVAHDRVRQLRDSATYAHR